MSAKYDINQVLLEIQEKENSNFDRYILTASGLAHFGFSNDNGGKPKVDENNTWHRCI